MNLQTKNHKLIRFLGVFILLLLFVAPTFGQIEIFGTVSKQEKSNRKGRPYAKISIKGKWKHTKADKYGRFSITVPDSNVILVFKARGYFTKEFKIGINFANKIRLEEDLSKRQKRIREEDSKWLPVIHSDTCFRSIGKPVIYLYPQIETDISLKLQYNGSLKTTYPIYNGGWNVHALPNGTLLNKADNKEYSYLFWDGQTNYTIDQTTFENGFVISSDTALTFLQNILPKTGLKPREYNEFIVYWLPFLKANRLTFVHFRNGDNYNIISKNEVTPKPDTQIRVFMEFKTVDTFFKVNPQTFPTLIRQGFTLVEWGGSMLTKAIKVKDENGVLKTR